MYLCNNCSMCVVTKTAGFIQSEKWKCLDREREVGQDDGCTFGDDEGQSVGVTQYDVDLSLTAIGMVDF